MDLSDTFARWERSLAQAFRFADTDNTLDAVARLERLQDVVSEQLAHMDEGQAKIDADDRKAVAAFQRRVEGSLASVTKRHDAWQHEVQARADAFEEAEQLAYKAPLASPGLD